MKQQKFLTKTVAMKKRDNVWVLLRLLPKTIGMSRNCKMAAAFCHKNTENIYKYNMHTLTTYVSKIFKIFIRFKKSDQNV